MAMVLPPNLPVAEWLGDLDGLARRAPAFFAVQHRETTCEALNCDEAPEMDASPIVPTREDQDIFRRLPSSYAAAAGRSSLRLAGDNLALDASVASPMAGVARHRPSDQNRGEQALEKRFACCSIGDIHVDIADWAARPRIMLGLIGAIDRTSSFAFAKLVDGAGKMRAAQFLRDVIAWTPPRI